MIVYKALFINLKQQIMGLADGMASEQEYGIKEKLNIPVSDDYIINGSGLFHWNSSIKKEVKLKMVEWYNNLSSA